MREICMQNAAVSSAYRTPSFRTYPVRPSGGRAGSASPLTQFVLLSMLFHALAVMLFGAPSGGSREGRAMWGSLDVVLMPSASEPSPVLRLDRAILAQPPKPREARPEMEPKASPLPDLSPAPIPPPIDTPFALPPLLDRLVTPEPRLEKLAPLRLPPPIETPALPTPPVQRAPVELPPVPIPATPPVESAPLQVPAVPIPATPPVERTLVAVPAVPVPVAAPVERVPVEVPAIPIAPALEPRAAPAPPLPTVRSEPVVQEPATRIDREPIAKPLPAPPAPAAAPPVPAGAPRDRRDEPAGKAYDPTAPSLDLDALRARAGNLAREGTGRRAVLPFPMPPVPERKSKEAIAIENARKPDCRTAYKETGLFAVIPLIANEFGEGNCRW